MRIFVLASPAAEAGAADGVSIDGAGVDVSTELSNLDRFLCDDNGSGF